MKNLKLKITALQKEITNFIHYKEEHPDYDVDIIPTTLSQIRNIYRGWSSNYGALVGYIFNSTWNRKPNLTIPSVRKDKLGYVIRIGTGISSMNQIPMSIIFGYLNPLIKDRGHLLHTTCTKFKEKMWSLRELSFVVNKEKTELTQDDGNKIIDTSKDKALEIIDMLEDFIADRKLRFIKEGTKATGDMFVSIEEICDNVVAFDNKLNHSKVSIEIRRESIWAHIKEILKINNFVNKWLDVQKGFLSFWGYCHDKDGNSTYIDDILEYDGLCVEYRRDDFWSGSDMEKYPILHKQIKEFNNKIADSGSMVVPMFLNSVSLLTDNFKSLGEIFVVRKDSDYYEVLKGLHTNKIDRETFSDNSNLYKLISKQSYWKTFDDNIKTLQTVWERKTDNLNNLPHMNINDISYGGLCILACAEIAKMRCDDRTSEIQISSIVSEFTDRLYQKVVDICEDGTMFSSNSSAGVRFDLTTLQIYKEMTTISDKTQLSKDELTKAHYQQLLKQFGEDINREFSVIALKSESYSNPEVVTMDLRVCKNGKRDGSGMDLGQKNQTGGYTSDNTFLQQKKHNRSSNNSNHIISGIEYMRWFVTENYDRVQNNKQYFMDSEQFNVLSDAKDLKRIFS